MVKNTISFSEAWVARQKLNQCILIWMKKKMELKDGWKAENAKHIQENVVWYFLSSFHRHSKQIAYVIDKTCSQLNWTHIGSEWNYVNIQCQTKGIKSLDIASKQFNCSPVCGVRQGGMEFDFKWLLWLLLCALKNKNTSNLISWLNWIALNIH